MSLGELLDPVRDSRLPGAEPIRVAAAPAGSAA